MSYNNFSRWVRDNRELQDLSLDEYRMLQKAFEAGMSEVSKEIIMDDYDRKSSFDDMRTMMRRLEELQQENERLSRLLDNTARL